MPDQQLNAPVASGGASDHAEHHVVIGGGAAAHQEAGHPRNLHEYALHGLGRVITGTLARAMSRRSDPQAKLH